MNKKAEAYGRPIGRPAKANKKVVVPLNLNTDTAERLTKFSYLSNRSKSAIADEAIARYLDNA